MKFTWAEWRERIADKKLAKATNDYDRGYEDGHKEGYERGRLSLYGVLRRVTTLETRVERLDKLLAELRTKGAGSEKTTTKMA